MDNLSDVQKAAVIKEVVEKALALTGLNSQGPTEPPPRIEDLLTLHQLCGIFNKDRQAVEKLGIPRVVLSPGDHRYDPADVRAFIEGRKERPKA